MWPFTDPKPNSIEEIDPYPGSLLCIHCGTTPQTLYILNHLYYCESCCEAELRREQFKSEEHL